MDTITLALVIALIAVLALIYYTRSDHKVEPKKSQIKKIPGLSKSESKDGVVIFGEFSLFMKDLHKRFGPIASFYQDNIYAVSIADPDLMKPLRNQEVIPSDIFKQFEIVTGSESFPFQELEEIRRRRKLYDHHFMLKACKSYTDCFIEIANEYAEKWRKLNKDDQIPLMETFLLATLKGILRTSYGDYFKDEESIIHFKNLFVNVSLLLEKQVKPDSEEDKQMKEYVEEIRSIVKKILVSREQDTSDHDENLFIDVLLEDNKSKEAQLGDSVMFILGGYEVTGKTIMWAIYDLADQPELQEKMYEELKSVLGENQFSLEAMPKLKYLSQVVDETIRLRLRTIFNARLIVEDFKVGDYIIPANSRLYMNTGVMFDDTKYYANADKFDPEHFSPENNKRRHPYAWKPFGFAGRRQCPGQSYARIKITTFLAEWIRQFRFKLVPDQNLKFVQGNMLRPESDIWVTVEPRN